MLLLKVKKLKMMDCIRNYRVLLVGPTVKKNIMLMGDFNAIVGNFKIDEFILTFGEEICNINGSRLSDFMANNQLIIMNIRTDVNTHGLGQSQITDHSLLVSAIHLKSRWSGEKKA